MHYTDAERIEAIKKIVTLEATRLGASQNDLMAAQIAAEFAFTVWRKSAYASAAHGIATIKRRLGIKREGQCHAED